jgi:hypothetical protein
MHHYVLRETGTLKEFDWTTGNRGQALRQFSKELGTDLTLEGPSDVAPAYMLDEWPNGTGPHMVNPTIPVYRVH